MKLQIPMRVRFRRLLTDLKSKIPFVKTATLTDLGEAFLLHLKNIARGNEASSPMARELVGEVMKSLNVNEKEAVQTIYASFYQIGLIDEIDLAELQIIINESQK